MKYWRFVNAFTRCSQINPDYAPITLREDYFPLRTTYQKFIPSRQLFWMTRNIIQFRSRSRYRLVQIPIRKTTPFRLSVTAYSIHSSLVKNVPASADWGGPMSWWHGPTYHGYLQPNRIGVSGTTKYRGFLVVKKQYYVFLSVCL